MNAPITKDFLAEKVAAALAARHCFFDEEGEQMYDVSECESKDSIRLMFKWEFDRATNKASPILDMANWSFNEEYEELVFCIGKDWNTGTTFYIAACWEHHPNINGGDGHINWNLSDHP